MRRFFLSAAISGALLMSAAGTALAASENQAEPGVPGDPNCVGQTMAYLAQVGTESGIHGIGGIADAFDLSVKEVKAIVSEYCAGE